MDRFRPVLIGILGAFGLLGLYFLIVTLAESAAHAVQQFELYGFWIVLLSAGFGVQLGLHTFIQARLRQRNGAAAGVAGAQPPGGTAEAGSRGGAANLAASGGLSTGAMIACCAHHLVDVLPILGLSAAAIFLVRYQLGFMVLGAGSSLVGVVMMLSIIQRHGLYRPHGWLHGLFAMNLRLLRNFTFALAAVAVVATFLLAGPRAGASGNREKVQPVEAAQPAAGTAQPAAEVAQPADKGASPAPGRDLEAEVDERNFVSVEVQPLDFQAGAPVSFVVKLNTHQGDLGFDLTRIAVLEDDLGNRYLPSGWSGAPPGGHHRSGTLHFPPLAPDAGRMRLVLKNIYQVPERAFEWGL